MRNPLAGNRTDEEWVWELLDLNDGLIGMLDGVKGGSLNRNVNATIRTGGKMQWSGKGSDQPNWLTCRVRPRYRATLEDGSQIDWQMGVFIPATPGLTWTNDVASADVDLYDKLVVLTDDKVDATYALDAGVVVVQAIRDLIESAGETKHLITDDTETLLTPMTWEVGTTKLEIINDLLQSINYFSLYCDDAGYYRGEPYLPPADRGLAWEFFDDQNGIYAPGFGQDQDYFGIPNRVVLVGQGTEDTEALVGVYTNDDPTDPLSINEPDPAAGVEGRGRVVTITETGVDATSQSVIDGLAQRRWQDMSTLTSTLEIEHALIPLTFNDVVAFRREPADILVPRGTVQEMDITCSSGSLVKTKIRQVK